MSAGSQGGKAPACKAGHHGFDSRPALQTVTDERTGGWGNGRISGLSGVTDQLNTLSERDLPEVVYGNREQCYRIDWAHPPGLPG